MCRRRDLNTCESRASVRKYYRFVDAFIPPHAETYARQLESGMAVDETQVRENQRRAPPKQETETPAGEVVDVKRKSKTTHHAQRKLNQIGEQRKLQVIDTVFLRASHQLPYCFRRRCCRRSTSASTRSWFVVRRRSAPRIVHSSRSDSQPPPDPVVDGPVHSCCISVSETRSIEREGIEQKFVGIIKAAKEEIMKMLSKKERFITGDGERQYKRCGMIRNNSRARSEAMRSESLVGRGKMHSSVRRQVVGRIPSAQ